MRDKTYYRSLTRNMALVMILVSLAPLLLVSGIIGYWFETSYRSKVLAHLGEVVEKHQQNIDLFLNEKLAYLRVLSNSFNYEQLTNEGYLAHKLALLQQAYGGVFVDLGVIDEHGVQQAYAGLFKLEHANYSDADWFKQVMARQSFISDVFLGLRREPHFIVAIHREAEGKNWIVRATIDFFAFNSLVENVRIGETGSAFILNRAGEFQTRPRPEQMLTRSFFMDLIRSKATGGVQAGGESAEGSGFLGATPAHGISPEAMPQSAHEWTGEGVKDGLNFIYVLAPLKDGQWVLVYQQNKEDAFKDLYNARKLVFAILALGIFGIMAVAFLLSKRMVRYIERADQEKEMMNEQVIEAGKLASLGELAAGIAHEINNPVAIMVEEAGWMEDLLDEEELRGSSNLSEFQRALDQIRVQGTRCKEITHKLLSFARKTDPNLHTVQLNELIEEVVGLSEQNAKYSNVRIKKDLAESIPTILASPSELQQVILNLVNNAVDAIGMKGGEVTVSTRADDTRVTLTVTDTGQGIPQAVLGRIFDPFFTTKPVGKGTGLGLSICYGIVNKMGGEISVNSVVGLGTSFHVRLPLAKVGA